MADRDEDFNTRYGSYRGWQMAIEKVKPIPRTVPQIDLDRHGARGGLEEHRARWSTTSLVRFMRVPLDPEQRRTLIEFPGPGAWHQPMCRRADATWRIRCACSCT